MTLSNEEIKERSKTICRHCEQTIWLFIGPDGSLKPDWWTANDKTIVCREGLLHEPVEGDNYSRADHE